jgi:hypothetical protein
MGLISKHQNPKGHPAHASLGFVHCSASLPPPSPVPSTVRRGTFPPSLSPALRLLPLACRDGLHRRRLRQPGREAGGRPPRRGGDAPRETQARRLPARPASGPRRRVRGKIFVSAFFVRV